MAQYIFVTGGVLSSLGKGIAASSIAALLQAHNYTVSIRKLDPYLNLDPGTMSPFQHGEVFVCDDGTEADLDLGHYERFTDTPASRANSITAGRVYFDVIERERRGDYLGGTVQVIPHITDRIKEFILNQRDEYDFIICELGGTVGDIEGLPFIEAFRQLRNEMGYGQALFIHLTLVPYIETAQEFKTKPSQHSVKELLSLGIQPDILICRSVKSFPEDARKKLALFCNVPANRVFEAIDAQSIYEVPLLFKAQGMDLEILSFFNKDHLDNAQMERFEGIKRAIQETHKSVTIGIAGKYTDLPDADKSLMEALKHGGFSKHVKVIIKVIPAESLETQTIEDAFKGLDGIVVPGGFGKRGVDGKMRALEYARIHKIPCLGICYGMQLMLIEYARHMLKLTEAGTTEWGPCDHPIVGLIEEWITPDGAKATGTTSQLGGTMRLGSYACHLKPHTKARALYGMDIIHERHRHRYEANSKYKTRFEDAGFIFSGMSPDGLLPEVVELSTHPYYIGVQFHPEFKSRPFQAHPLFLGLIEAALKD